MLVALAGVRQKVPVRCLRCPQSAPPAAPSPRSGAKPAEQDLPGREEAFARWSEGRCNSLWTRFCFPAHFVTPVKCVLCISASLLSPGTGKCCRSPSSEAQAWP